MEDNKNLTQNVPADEPPAVEPAPGKEPPAAPPAPKDDTVIGEMSPASGTPPAPVNRDELRQARG
jgi:hypothetical protein